MIRVTFDSNVWQQVASPDQYPNHVEVAAFRAIHAAIRSSQVAAFVSEAIFTIEAIKKDFRQSFISSYDPIKAVWKNELTDDGMHQMTISIGPDITAHPGQNSHLTKYLESALNSGFKLIRCTRIGQITKPDIEQSFFVHQSGDEILERMDRCSACCEYIETIGCGISHLKNIGSQYTIDRANWRTGLKSAPETENKRISKAFAEWADGDALASHYGYRNDYFCTLDEGKKAGASSVFHSKNKTKLEQKFGLKIISPERLRRLIEH